MSGPFLDTSILIGGLIDLGNPSDAPIKVLDRVAEGTTRDPCTAWHCCLEFYSVVTRLPEEYRLEPADALTLLDEEVFGRFRIGSLPAGSRERFLRTAVRQGVRGGRIYDAHIGAVALAMGAQVLVTENLRHFSNYDGRGLRVVTAGEFLSGTG